MSSKGGPEVSEVDSVENKFVSSESSPVTNAEWAPNQERREDSFYICVEPGQADDYQASGSGACS